MKKDNEIERIRDLSPSQIRIPSKLKARLKESAKANRQSLSAEIVKRLEGSYSVKTNEEILGVLDALAEAVKSGALEKVTPDD